MLMKNLPLLRSEIILKDQDLWDYREKKDQGKIPQNVSEEKFRESGQLNKAVENKDVLLTMSQYQDDLKKTAPSYETLSYSNVKVSQRKNLGRVDS